MSVFILCYLFQNIYVHSTIPCGYRFANMYKLSVIVIDKPIGLDGTISTCKSIFMSHLCTIYHQNKRFENMVHLNAMPQYSRWIMFVCVSQCLCPRVCVLFHDGLSKDILSHV